jgi:hypothetical protein
MDRSTTRQLRGMDVGDRVGNVIEAAPPCVISSPPGGTVSIRESLVFDCLLHLRLP